MPKYSRTRLTKPFKPQPDTWVTITWDTVSGDAGKEGEAYIDIAPSTFTATMTAKLSVSGAAVATRFVEREKDNSGHWQNAEEYPPVEHATTAGTTFIADTRTQNVQKGRRVIAQIKLPEGGTVEAADWHCLYF
jgi:hypothetical protein